MSFGTISTSRYVPHSDTTKAQYEQLLLDLRRCLPPGVDDDITDIAEETLAVVCDHNESTPLPEKQRMLEQLLDMKLSRDMMDRFIQYGKQITDYVPATTQQAIQALLPATNEEARSGGIQHLEYVGEEEEAVPGASSSSSSSDDDNDEANGGIDELTGMPLAGKKSRKKALRADRNLVMYAFDTGDVAHERVAAGINEDAENYAVNEETVAELEGLEDDEDGQDHAGGLYGGGQKPKFSFDEVACNTRFLKDALRRLFPSEDTITCEARAQRVLGFLEQRDKDQLTLETQLTAYLGCYDDEAASDWVGDVVNSRWCIVYGLRYAACETQKEKQKVMDTMQEHAAKEESVEWLYQSLTGKEVDLDVRKRQQQQQRQRAGGANETAADAAGEGDGDLDGGVGSSEARRPPLRKLDLQACAFQDERTPHLHVRAKVPANTQVASFDTHDEITLPPVSVSARQDALVPLSRFPEWARPAFPGVETLNPMQSKVFEAALLSDENLLISAPTGAGKTNVAAMTMMRAVENLRSSGSGTVNLRELKMVYVAPMKALVQEVVRTFSARLEPLGLTVAELSGDSAMTQQQMAETQLIVTTPEKWDIVTRRSVELGVASLLKLLIIDEVHLLHNERGPVLEAIVARTMQQQQRRGEGGIRIVGLSATLPNYQDVASFLQVNRQRGLFVFDGSYRPIPLEQTFCAIKKVPGMNRAATMNRVVYDKVLQTVQDDEQMMVFVHSRKETEYTAQYLRQRAQEENRIHSFVRPNSEEHLKELVSLGGMGHALRRSLQQLLPYGFAVHHAGLSREERQTVEEAFAERHVRVLVCTSTLAWGVNLPANRVLIKGTRVFNGAKGESELLSALDVLQMFGRAGRVGFGATVGRATILTSPDDLHYYLSILNQQLPIESQMMKRVVDMLNAEVVLGHIETTQEGVQWLQRTYLYVRMCQRPELYSIRPSTRDPLLLHHLENIVHTACEELKAAKMVEYDSRARRVAPTPYGRIASSCYITTRSMATYLQHMRRAMQDTDLFRLFALSSEFQHISVRAEEQEQLRELMESAPVAVKESRYTPLAKINVLLQCYISGNDLEGLPLMSEMVYIQDSAQRILRALFEIALVREYGRTARQFLSLYLMVLHRQWAVQSPVRPVRHILSTKDAEVVVPAIERMRAPWEEVRQWSVEDLVEKLNDDRRAERAHDLIHHVPHYTVEASVRPLSRNMLYLDVDITPDFTYNEELHGRGVRDVVLLVEHTNGHLLYSETISLPMHCLRQSSPYACPPIVIPVTDPKPSHVLVHGVSPYWLTGNGTATAPVSLLNTLLPAVAPPLREVQERPPTETSHTTEVASVLEVYKLAAVGEKLFPFDNFLAPQYDLVSPIMDSSHNLFVGVPPGGGKTVIAELFMLQFLLECALKEAQDDESNARNGGEAAMKSKVLYLTTNDAVAHRHAQEWQYKFGELLEQRVVLVDSQSAAAAAITTTPVDSSEAGSSVAAALHDAAIVVGSAENLVLAVRTGAHWLSGVTHIIADHIHHIRCDEGRSLEECLARLQTKPFLTQHGTKRARVLALSYPLISSAEVSRWLRVPLDGQFNYGTSYRQMRVRMEGLALPQPRSRYETSVVSALNLLQRTPYKGASAVLFLPDAREAENVARRVLMRCRGYVPETAIADDVDNARLALYLAAGVGFLHRGTSDMDVLTTLSCLDTPAKHPATGETLPLILVCAFEAAWRLPAASFANAFVCCAERIAMEVAEGDEDNARVPICADCDTAELQCMTARALHEAVVFCRLPRRWAWNQLLNEPLPLESTLCYPEDFRGAVNAAVAQGRVVMRVEVLHVLKAHYWLNHVPSNLHFYGVPSKEDIPLYASEFAWRVLALLEEQGCVEVAHGTKTGLDVEAAEGQDNDDDDDDDPRAAVRPTRRGAALCHHGISMDTLTSLLGAAQDASQRPRQTLASVWAMLAKHCLELSASRLGDAARVMDSAEGRALTTLARALPASMSVSFLDLDFHQSHTKVFLLVLAHCARFFGCASARRTAAASEEDVAQASALLHPLQFAPVPESERALLCQIPEPIAHQLADDLRHILPTVLRVVPVMAELLDGDDSSAVFTVRSVMQLSQCIHRQVWSYEAPWRQLPGLASRRDGNVLGDDFVCALGTTTSAMEAPQGSKTHLSLSHKTAPMTEAGAGDAGGALTMATLQSRAAGHGKPSPVLLRLCEEAVSIQHALPSTIVLRGMPGHAAHLSLTAAQLADSLEQAAMYVPRLMQLRARGTVQPMEGTLAMLIDVEAELHWAGLTGSVSPIAAADAMRWWLSCYTQPKTATTEQLTRLLALRVVSAIEALPSSHKAAASESLVSDAATHKLTGRLFFPLQRLEQDGVDLDNVDVVVAATSLAYRSDGLTTVLFEVSE